MKKGIIAAVAAVALVLALYVFAAHPIILCGTEIPETCLEAIEDQSKGLYSTKLPLVPICVTVDEYTGGAVYYTICYFPFGTVGMSYTEGDGYNIEKSLSGLQ